MSEPATTTREGVLGLVLKEPTLSASEMARRLGVSRERARQILESLNYEWHPGQWKRRRK